MNETKDQKTQAQTGSQIYLGMPNGIVLCADKGSEHGIRGRFYHLYSRDPVYFENEDQLIFEMERFFDSIHFPHPGTIIRSFEEKGKTGRGASGAGTGTRGKAKAEDWQNLKSLVEGQREDTAQDDRKTDAPTQDVNGFTPIGKREKVMKDQELLGKHGDMGSFIIRVQQRQNSSMQGRLTWVEKNKTVYFRSVWELIRLIDSAVEMSNPSPEEELPSWDD